MEVTTWIEALWREGLTALGGSATMQAGTRVNAEQASKRLTRKPTLLSSGEGRRPAGKRATKPGRFPPG